MRIEFDPTNRDEATAVRAVLAALHGAEPVPHVIFASGDPDPIKLGEGERRFAVMEPSDKEKWDTDAPVAGVPDLDANNEPHDPRIHSTPAKTNADGTWRAKRGVTAEQVSAVRAEREATQTTQAIDPRELEANGIHPDDMNDPVYEYTPEPTTEAPKAPLEESAPATPPAPPVSEPSNTHTAAPTPPAPTVPAGSSGEYSFLDVMKAITAAQKDGHVTTAKVKELCAAIGAGDSTMGLNGADKGELRVQFMALLDGEVGQ